MREAAKKISTSMGWFELHYLPDDAKLTIVNIGDKYKAGKVSDIFFTVADFKKLLSALRGWEVK